MKAMTGDRTYTAREIAEIVDVHKTTIMRRAKKESWPAVAGNGKGGDHVKYPLPALPETSMPYNKEGRPRN